MVLPTMSFGEAMAYLNTALGSFGVLLSWAAPDTYADVHVHFASRTPYGGAADGVLGFTTADNDVYLVTGWNFYTGADPTGRDQSRPRRSRWCVGNRWRVTW